MVTVAGRTVTFVGKTVTVAGKKETFPGTMATVAGRTVSVLPLMETVRDRMVSVGQNNLNVPPIARCSDRASGADAMGDGWPEPATWPVALPGWLYRKDRAIRLRPLRA